MGTNLPNIAQVLMRIPRIYTTSELQTSAEVCLDTNACKHIKEVLRLKCNDKVVLFNGDGFDYQSEIKEIVKKRVTVSVADKIQISNESALNIHILLPLCRNDKMDWCIQKATELGVHEITPVISKRVNINIPQDRLTKKLSHWHAVAASACEQCGRAIIPAINSPMQLAQAVESVTTDTLKIVASPSSNKKLLTLSENEITNCACLVGPEGGLSTEEITLVEKEGFHSVSLGPRILRLETAVITLITLIQTRWGDLH